MAIQRWDPLRDLVSLQDRMNKLFEDSMSRSRAGGDDAIVAAAWAPAVDIYETDKEIVIKAELPEIDKKDLEVRIENNTLTIRGERRLESETKKENYHRIERSYGTFARSFGLPDAVDPEAVDATFRDGILKLVLHKRSETRARSIKIETT
ncbi:MAG: Hsp20/alpha crystallin family protein [Acidobacteria bacterium]|nr:Hsp20/alpha crystallin family protein [Acidobacteriota bacterium]